MTRTRATGPRPSEWATTLEAVNGPLTSELRRTIVLAEQERARRLAIVFEAVQVLTKLYYENYTDATYLEASWLNGILCQFNESLVPEALVFEAIRVAEDEINQAGGVMSDSGEGLHLVRTDHAYNDEDSDD